MQRPTNPISAYVLAAALTVATAQDAYAGYSFQDMGKNFGNFIKGLFGVKKTEEIAKPRASAERVPAKKAVGKLGDCTDENPCLITNLETRVEGCDSAHRTIGLNAAHCTGELNAFTASENHPISFTGYSIANPKSRIPIKPSSVDGMVLKVYDGDDLIYTGSPSFIPKNEGLFTYTLTAMLTNGTPCAQVHGGILVGPCPAEPVPSAEVSPVAAEHDTIYVPVPVPAPPPKEKPAPRCDKKPIERVLCAGPQDVISLGIMASGTRANGTRTYASGTFVADKESAGGMIENHTLTLVLKSSVAQGSVLYDHTHLEGTDAVLGKTYPAAVDQWMIDAGLLRTLGSTTITPVIGGNYTHTGRTTYQQAVIGEHDGKPVWGNKAVKTGTNGLDAFGAVGVGKPSHLFGYAGIGYAWEKESGNGNSQSQDGLMLTAGGSMEDGRFGLEGQVSKIFYRSGGSGFSGSEDRVVAESIGRLRLFNKVGVIGRLRYTDGKITIESPDKGVSTGHETVKKAALGLSYNF